MFPLLVVNILLFATIAIVNYATEPNFLVNVVALFGIALQPLFAFAGIKAREERH